MKLLIELPDVTDLKDASLLPFGLNPILHGVSYSVALMRERRVPRPPLDSKEGVIFRSASSSITRSGKKKNNRKVSNCNSLLSPASTCTLMLNS